MNTGLFAPARGGSVGHSAMRAARVLPASGWSVPASADHLAAPLFQYRKERAAGVENMGAGEVRGLIRIAFPAGFEYRQVLPVGSLHAIRKGELGAQIAIDPIE